MLAFIIWALMGVAFIVLGIYALFSKSARPLGFWSNAKTLPMKDVKGYLLPGARHDIFHEVSSGAAEAAVNLILEWMAL